MSSIPTVEMLKEEYSAKSDAELVEICKRLEKSQASMTELLNSMQEEHTELETEKVSLNQTIDVLMRDMGRLQIGSSNTVDPQLQEGPLNIVNRMWSKFGPKEQAVLANERVGELRKDPKALDKENKQVTQHTMTLRHVEGFGNKVGGLFNQVRQSIPDNVKQNLNTMKDKVVEQATELRATAGPTVAGYAGAAGNAAGNLAGAATNFLSQDPTQRAAPMSRAGEDANDEAALRQDPFLRAGGAGAAHPKQQGKQGRRKEAAEGSGSSPPPKTAAESSSGTPPSAGKKEEAAEEKQKPEEDEAAADAEEDDDDPGAAVGDDDEFGDAQENDEDDDLADQISSTVLIEAKIRLGDGSEQALQVRAADRCKEVAARFVKEHSLKSTFEAPLTAYLKQVENDAEKFPHVVEADLMAIHQEFGGQA